MCRLLYPVSPVSRWRKDLNVYWQLIVFVDGITKSYISCIFMGWISWLISGPLAICKSISGFFSSTPDRQFGVYLASSGSAQIFSLPGTKWAWVRGGAPKRMPHYYTFFLKQHQLLNLENNQWWQVCGLAFVRPNFQQTLISDCSQGANPCGESTRRWRTRADHFLGILDSRKRPPCWRQGLRNGKEGAAFPLGKKFWWAFSDLFCLCKTDWIRLEPYFLQQKTRTNGSVTYWSGASLGQPCPQQAIGAHSVAQVYNDSVPYGWTHQTGKTKADFALRPAVYRIQDDARKWRKALAWISHTVTACCTKLHPQIHNIHI